MPSSWKVGRHADVGHEHLWPRGVGGRQQLVEVGRRADDLQVALESEQRPDAFAHQQVVVGQQHRDRPVALVIAHAVIDGPTAAGATRGRTSRAAVMPASPRGRRSPWWLAGGGCGSCRHAHFPFHTDSWSPARRPRSCLGAAACGDDDTAEPAATTTADQTPATTAAAPETTAAAPETTAAATDDHQLLTSTAFCQAEIALESAVAAEDPEGDRPGLRGAERCGPGRRQGLGRHRDRRGPEVHGRRRRSERLSSMTPTPRSSASSRTTAGSPTCRCTASNYQFNGLPREVAAGPAVITFENTANEFHEMILFRINDDVTENLGRSCSPSRKTRRGRKVIPVGVPRSPLPARPAYTALDLAPGRYVAVCFVPKGDHARGDGRRWSTAAFRTGGQAPLHARHGRRNSRWRDEHDEAHRITGHGGLLDPLGGRDGRPTRRPSPPSPTTTTRRPTDRRRNDTAEQGATLDAWRDADRFRFANQLGAWIEVDGGAIVGAGYCGEAASAAPGWTVGSKSVTFQAAQMPTIQAEPVYGDGWVRFEQTAGGRTGVPAPRRVNHPPFVQFRAPLAWSTLRPDAARRRAQRVRADRRQPVPAALGLRRRRPARRQGRQRPTSRTGTATPSAATLHGVTPTRRRS